MNNHKHDTTHPRQVLPIFYIGPVSRPRRTDNCHVCVTYVTKSHGSSHGNHHAPLTGSWGCGCWKGGAGSSVVNKNWRELLTINYPGPTNKLYSSRKRKRWPTKLLWRKTTCLCIKWSLSSCKCLLIEIKMWFNAKFHPFFWQQKKQL